MASDAEAVTPSKCIGCGYAAPDGSDEWDRVKSPSLGRLTRCPECGSTNVMTGL